MLAYSQNKIICHMAQQPRRLPSIFKLLWKPQILQKNFRLFYGLISAFSKEIKEEIFDKIVNERD
jgi:hypothetical protein